MSQLRRMKSMIGREAVLRSEQLALEIHIYILFNPSTSPLHANVGNVLPQG